MENVIPYIRDKNFIPAGKSVAHGFFGRRGGVSAGLYDSLNCGIGTQDSFENIFENRRRVADALGAEHLPGLRQVHGAACLIVREPWGMDARPEGDAFITDVPGIALGVLTADCGPVLFYGEKTDGSPVIGAAHAGWGGALKGVLEETVRTMLQYGVVRESVRAAIGPCIDRKSYEVRDDFAAPFLVQGPANEHFFNSARRAGHLMFDLPGYIASRLAGAGVRHVSITGQDTYSTPQDYFSYRRATHNGEQNYGRQISALVIR